jgi:hypothetical protein
MVESYSYRLQYTLLDYDPASSLAPLLHLDGRQIHTEIFEMWRYEHLADVSVLFTLQYGSSSALGRLERAREGAERLAE